MSYHIRRKSPKRGSPRDASSSVVTVTCTTGRRRPGNIRSRDIQSLGPVFSTLASHGQRILSREWRGNTLLANFYSDAYECLYFQRGWKAYRAILREQPSPSELDRLFSTPVVNATVSMLMVLLSAEGARWGVTCVRDIPLRKHTDTPPYWTQKGAYPKSGWQTYTNRSHAT